MSNLKVLVVGCGAVGIPYTWVLSRTIPEANIFAVCRSNRAVAAEKGLRMTSAVWGEDLVVKPVVVGSVGEAVEKNQGGSFDYIIISTKCLPPFSTMAERIAPAVEEGKTAIVLMQNGIGIEEPYAKAFPNNPILSTVVYIKTIETSPAFVEHINIQQLHIGTFPESAPASHKAAAEVLAKTLSDGGAAIKVHDDVQVERWSKTLVNSAWNPLTALSRLPDASFLASDPAAPDLTRSVMMETAAVARACGYETIDDKLLDWQLGRSLARELPGVSSSMMIDALSSRTMEADALIGNIVAKGEEKGVPTPLLRMLFLLVKGLNASFAAAA